MERIAGKGKKASFLAKNANSSGTSSPTGLLTQKGRISKPISRSLIGTQVRTLSHFKWVQPLLLQGFFGALNEGMQPLLPINGPAQLKEKLEHILTVCWMNSH
jgi:hypothetical protein